MNVDEVYRLMKFIANVNQQGYFGPDKFRLVINQGQRAYQSHLLGSFEQYTPGRPVARVELGQNSVVRQRLAPTIYGYILSVDAQGQSPYPHDYIQTDTMYSIYGVKRIRNVQQNQLDATYNSTIDPLATNPIYLIEDTNFQFYPTTTYQAKLHYVRNAPDIVWGYTLDGNNRPVYDPATSVDPVWDNAAMMDIIARALGELGIHLQSSAVVQFAAEQKNQGQ